MYNNHCKTSIFSLGRLGRARYFVFMVSPLIIYWALAQTFNFLGIASSSIQQRGGQAGNFGDAVTLLIGLVYVVFLVSISLRRLHDFGKSGRFIFLMPSPLVIPLIIFLMLKSGNDEINVYGDPPPPNGIFTKIATVICLITMLIPFIVAIVSTFQQY